MTDFVKMIRTLEYFCSGKGVGAETIQLAEQALGLRFAEEYREYLTSYGTASANGHELTGLGVSRRLDVTAVTEEEREKNPAVPDDLYVVEQVNIDDIVAWQSASGEIFLTAGQSQPVKTADSLIQYMAEIE